MGAWRDLIGTVNTVLKIGLNKASLDAGALTAPRTFTLPDVAGTLALLNDPVFTGNPTAPTAALFDNDTTIATTAYAMSVGMRANGRSSFGADTTLGAGHFGKALYYFNATTPGTLTLPAASSAPVGSVINISNINTAAVTVARGGTDVIYALGSLGGLSRTSLVLQFGDSVTLYTEGVNSFVQIAGTRLTDEYAAIAAGTTALSPSTAGRTIWSTTELETLTWDGTRWTAAAPHMGRKNIGYWRPQGNSTVVSGDGSYTAPTIVGTLTARNVATTNFFARMARVGLVSAATAGAFAEARVAVAQVTIGAGAGVGGFTKIVRFGCSDAAAVAGARMFVGVSSNTAAATNVEPSTLLNSIGVGHGAADTNLKIYFGGSAAQAPIDLGVNFPVNTLSVDAYELSLFASPNNGNVSYVVTRLNTGASATGTLTAATAGTQLPLNTTLLSYHKAWRCNNATALAVGLDIISDYIETDN